MAEAFIFFRVSRDDGSMTPLGVYEMGTSPSCLAINAAGTRLYSANETDRVGSKKKARLARSKSTGEAEA